MDTNFFKDLRIIDISTVLAGPSVGTFFAELGAEVIKVENIAQGGDVTRSWRLPGETEKVTAYFSAINYKKKYVDLDLNEPVYHSLMNLWDRILPGGYIVFDEYEYHKFDESNGVDLLLKDKLIKYEVVSTNWMAPTAYLIKKRD